MSKLWFYCLLSLSTFIFLNPEFTHSQFFVKVTDPANPIVSEALSGNYYGASWVDVDGDERLDLFICRKDIFRNLGNGNFVKLVGSVPFQGSVLGNSWSDYDNDGDIDLFVISTNQASPFSHLYNNDGSGMFTKITQGQIGDSASNTGWGCVWGDINNDSYTDLFLAAAYNFGGVLHPNRLFNNNGNGTFTRVDTTQTTDSNDAFTVPMFSDYDQDGDIDLFIGTGPANSIGGRDYLYRNMLKEFNSSYFFNRIDTGIIGTDIVDGQIWNWIDIDNDGDIDGFLTNYSTNILNRLYRCEGPYYYVKMTAAQVGTIVTDAGLWLSNTWGDFDNDGDLDCYLTTDAGLNRYYSNNGQGFFTRIDTLAMITSGPSYGAVSGDYDSDGDLDLFVAANNVSKGLYRNETNNNNKWINIRCVGSGPGNNFSNRSALGTIVKVKSTINSSPIWQIREVNAQNSFNSMNMLNVHFGLGNSAIIDSLVIKWPRGLVQVYTNVQPNRFYKATEGQGLNEVIIGLTQLGQDIPLNFSLSQNYPNPFNPSTKITFSIPFDRSGFKHITQIAVYDILGRLVTELVNGELAPGKYETQWNSASFSSGTYFYRLVSGSFSETKKMMLIK